MPQFDSHFFTPLLFWSIISFGILWFVLSRYAFPPILEMLDLREKKIKDSLEQAERLQNEAKKVMTDYENRIKQAREEAELILDKARMKGQHLLEESERRAREEADRTLAAARQEMEREKIRLMKEVRESAADLVISTTEKILQKSISRNEHEKLIEESIELSARKFGL